MARFTYYTKKTKASLRRGFTLIELMVVIAIIALLSAIVLVSLSLARKKANDAKVKAQLRNFKSAAELYYYNAGKNSYGTQVTGWDPNRPTVIGPGCDEGMFLAPTVAPFAAVSNYPAGVTGKCTVAANGQSYVMSAKLSDGTYWCVDSIGTAAVITTIQGNDGSSCYSTREVE